MTHQRHVHFNHVMLPHLDAAYNLARWIIRDSSLAEDVVQNAYERAYRYFASFQGGSGRAWLLQIVRNAAYTMLRAERGHVQNSLTGETPGDGERDVEMDLPDLGPGPETNLAIRQDLAAIDDVLDSLPVAWRECLILREVESFSYKEMARIMDIPIGTVMSSLARARQALQRSVLTTHIRTRG